MFAGLRRVSVWTEIAPIIVVPALFSLILDILFGNILDYRMYIFAYSLMVLLVFHISRADYILKLDALNGFSKKTVDYLVIVCASATFILVYFENVLPIFSMVVSAITVLFGPGWVLLRVLENNNNSIHNWGALFVMSFALSLVLTGIIFTLGSLYHPLLSPHALASLYLIISVIQIFRGAYSRKAETLNDKTNSFHKYRLSDILLLAWTLIFFTYVISSFYPDMAKVPGLDIVRHYSYSKGFLLSPEVYESVYPWYHYVLASILQLSSASMLTFQTATATLSFMLIFSFYIMSKAYLSRIDDHAPVWATVMFSVFSGFGWTYFLERVPNNIGVNLSILNQVVHGTYYDIGYAQGGWMWFWFRPVTLALTILFVLLFLMTNQKLHTRYYIFISSALLVALSQIHFSEFVIFVILIFVLSIFSPRLNLRLGATALSIIVALVASAGVTIFQSGVLYAASVSLQLTFALGILAAGSYLIIKYPKRPFSHLRIKVGNTTVLIVTSAALFVYLTLLIHWFLDAEAFQISDILPLYAVPWQFYPMVLGIAGVCAIIGIPIVLKLYKDYSIVLFFTMFLLMIFLGRIVTYIGSEFIFTGYFERRVVFLVFTAACILAPIGIFAIIKYLLKSDFVRRDRLRAGHIAAVAFISFLVTIGISSTFLSVSYQLEVLQELAIADNKVEIIQKLIDRNPLSTLLTASAQSYNIAQFSSPGYLIGHWSDQIWPSKSPELPLNIMSILDSSFIYVQGNDSQMISEKYSNGYINNHILRFGQEVYENKAEKIIQLPTFSPPSKHASDLILVLPDLGNMNQGLYFAYDLASLSGYNYTTTILSDVPSMREAKVLMVPSEEIALEMMQKKSEYDLKYDKMIVLNLDGQGEIWEQFTKLSSRDVLTSSTLRLSNGSTNANDNNISRILSLPAELKMIPRIPQVGVNQIAYFDHANVPFILEKELNQDIDLIYVNIYPIVREAPLINDKSGTMYEILEGVLKVLPDLDLPMYNTAMVRKPSGLILGGVAAFDRAEFEGSLELGSSSAIVGGINSPVRVTADGSVSVLEDVSQISPLQLDNIIIQGHRGGVLEEGFGFYSSIIMNQSEIHVGGSPAMVLVEDEKGGQTIVNGSEIRFTLGRSSTAIRQPTIISNGTASFADFYAYGELYNQIPALGQDIKVKGENFIEIDYSDVFSVGSSPSFEGEFPRKQLAYPYDELGSLSKVFSFPYMRHLAVLLILLGVIFVYLREKRTIFLR